MKGDFSRNTFDENNSFTRVLMQQGRVQVDADWNEQTSILLHYLSTLAKELIGDHGGSGDGLKIEILDVNGDPTTVASEFKNLGIGDGNYYVKGLLCEKTRGLDGEMIPQTYLEQANFPDAASFPDLPFLVYVDIWERHLTYVVDDDIREKALNGPDTATRSQLIWQIKQTDTITGVPDGEIFKTDYSRFLAELKIGSNPPEESEHGTGTGRLLARATVDSDADANLCMTSPESHYRGLENQLYRIEIHQGGKARVDSNQTDVATWKWSRENGSVVFPIRQLESDSEGTTVVAVERLGRDNRDELKAGDWVEVVDDNYVLMNKSERLLKVREVRVIDLQVILDGKPDMDIDLNKHPLLRRWDQTKKPPNESGVIEVTEGDWLSVEDGVQIRFENPTQGQEDSSNIHPRLYKTGDYWLIPARVATGDVEWPTTADNNPIAQLPRGVRHYYAPLAYIRTKSNGDLEAVDLRRKIKTAS